MTSIFHRQGNVLVPSDDEAMAELVAHEDGREMMVTMKGARNIKQHKLFFALSKIVAENDALYNGNVEAARKDILRACGHVDYEVDRWGHAHIIVKSMAFEKLTQAEFNPLFQAGVNVVSEWTHTKPQWIVDEVNKMVADKRYEGYRR